MPLQVPLGEPGSSCFQNQDPERASVGARGIGCRQGRSHLSQGDVWDFSAQQQCPGRGRQHRSPPCPCTLGQEELSSFRGSKLAVGARTLSPMMSCLRVPLLLAQPARCWVCWGLLGFAGRAGLAGSAGFAGNTGHLEHSEGGAGAGSVSWSLWVFGKRRFPPGRFWSHGHCGRAGQHWVLHSVCMVGPGQPCRKAPVLAEGRAGCV